MPATAEAGDGPSTDSFGNYMLIMHHGRRCTPSEAVAALRVGSIAPTCSPAEIDTLLVGCDFALTGPAPEVTTDPASIPARLAVGAIAILAFLALAHPTTRERQRQREAAGASGASSASSEASRSGGRHT